MTFLTRVDVRSVDQLAIDTYGLPGIVLMENAGRNATAALIRQIKDLAAEQFVIAVGPGNNGGDGLVMARHLDNAGAAVRVVLAAAPERFQGDALVNLRVVERSDIPLTCLAGATAAAWQAALASATYLIDALLGTGATGPARGGVAQAITAIVACRAEPPVPRVIAIDLPSGLDCDTGEPLGPCVMADATLSFVAAKIGFSEPEAASLTGRVEVLDIGVPRKLLSSFKI